MGLPPSSDRRTLQVAALVIGRARAFPRSDRSTLCAQLGTVPALSDGETRAFPCQPSAKPALRSWRNEIELLATAANLLKLPT